MNIAGLWDQLVLAVCRPPRDLYTEDDLVGGRRAGFRLGQKKYYRQDVELLSKEGLKVQASHYRPCVVTSIDGRLPAVIYCHCNSGSRRDAEEILYHLLPKGITVFALDFTGSGMSEGGYVTLGAQEVEDLEVAVQYLREEGSTSTIGLWGRSMGAVTALLYSQQDPSIAGMVLDSPFSRLSDLMMELATDQQLRIPKPLLKVAMAMMRRSVRKRAGFNIDTVAPLDRASESYIPALFGHAREDTFVNKHHSERLFAAHSGDKNFITFDGDHNSVRPDYFYTSAMIFLLHALRVPELVGPDLDLQSAEEMQDLPHLAQGDGSIYIASSRSLPGSPTAADGSTAGSTPRSPGALHRLLTPPWDRATLPGHHSTGAAAGAHPSTVLTGERQQQQQQQQQQGGSGGAGAGPGTQGGVRRESPYASAMSETGFQSEELGSMDEEAALQQALELSLKEMRQQQEQQLQQIEGGGDAGTPEHRRYNPLYSSSEPQNPLYAADAGAPLSREDEEAMLARAIEESLRLQDTSKEQQQVQAAGQAQPQAQQQQQQQQQQVGPQAREASGDGAQPTHVLTHSPRLLHGAGAGAGLSAAMGDHQGNAMQHSQQEASAVRMASAELQKALLGASHPPQASPAGGGGALAAEPLARSGGGGPGGLSGRDLGRGGEDEEERLQSLRGQAAAAANAGLQ